MAANAADAITTLHPAFASYVDAGRAKPRPAVTSYETASAGFVVVGGTARGDRRAIGCIAIVLAPRRMAEARDELGEHYADDDGDVLQEFFLVLCEAGLTFPAIRGAGEAWLGKMARQVAREHLSKRRQFPREAG